MFPKLIFVSPHLCTMNSGFFSMTKEDKSIPLNSLAGCKWWDIVVSESPVVESAPSLDSAMDLYEETLFAFEQLMKKDTEQQWLRKVAISGTHSDQINALVTLTQMCPVLGMPHIRQLLILAQTKANRVIQPALAALKKLLVEELLPTNRKLSFFADQKPSKKGALPHKSSVLMWYFEDFLKKTMATFVQLLFDAQSSPIEAIRTSCVDFSFDILTTYKGAGVHGEQEKPMLKILVKGMGDKAEKRVSAKAALLVVKLAQRRTHLKEEIIEEVREQHLVGGLKTDSAVDANSCYSRGINMALSMFTTFPLHPQDDAFVAGKLVGILSQFVNDLIKKKQDRDRKRKLQTSCGLSEADAKLLRLCLKALETAFAAAGSDCPIPETTNALLLKLSHETHVAGLSVAILNFLNRISKELKLDSPKLVRAIFAQAGNMSVYLGSAQLAWLLSLVKDSVLDDSFSKETTKNAFRRRLMQLGACVSEPSVLPVVMALTEPKQLEIDLIKAKEDEEDSMGEDKFGYNAGFWDPLQANPEAETRLWERHLLKHHFEQTVRVAADSVPVEVPEEAKSLTQLLVDVSTMQLEQGKKKRKTEDLDDVEIPIPGL